MQEFEEENTVCPICNEAKCIKEHDWCFDCRDAFYAELESEDRTMPNKIEKTAKVFRWGAVYLIAVAFGFVIWALIELARIFTTGG